MSYFDLQKALDEWKKKLHKHEGFEEGTAEELLSHVRDAIEDLVAQGKGEEEAFQVVTQQKVGDIERLALEYHKARSIRTSPFHSKKGPGLPSNFLKVAMRNIAAKKPHSIINLTGLALGLASAMLVSFYVFSELGFDRFHADGQQIFRVLSKRERGGSELVFPLGPPALAPALTENFPEIELATRVRYADRPLFQYGEKLGYESHVFYADSSYLKIFDFELMEGNRGTALSKPNSVVLTHRLARKYFGGEDPINKIIVMEGNRPLLVTGVAGDVPPNSHFYFEALISFQSYSVPDGYLEGLDSWAWMGFLTYVKSHKGANIPSLEKKIANYVTAHEPRYEQDGFHVELQPLWDIYLGSSHLGNPHNIFRASSYNTMLSLAAVGLLIILIAAFNYINLSIAMSMSRYKEIAMRKVLGSTKGKLILQFILESLVYSFLSLAIAVAMIAAGQHFLPGAIVSRLYLGGAQWAAYCTSTLVFVAVIGGISGLFPALRLSSISPLQLLSGTFAMKEGNLRNILIGFQFALSAALVAISLVIGQQVRFFNNKDLGFHKEGVVSINIGSGQVTGKAGPLQNEIKSLAGVYSTSQASHIMGEGLSSGPLVPQGENEEDAIQMNYFQTDYDFLATMGLQLVDGRFFSREFHRDSTTSILLNETAIKTLGLTDPIGKRVLFAGEEREIIGIVKDFHFNSLHQAIAPMAIIMPFTHVGQLLVRFRGENVYRTLGRIDNLWKEVFPNVPFEFQFVDDHLGSLYAKESLFASVIRFFTVVATGIACLGLYSLAAISLAGKLKQISIRRVLGAPLRSIALLTGKGFLLLVVVSTLLSWPLAWYLMNKWLSHFAYHITVSPRYFAITLGTILSIALATMAYHLFKAVTVNPAKTLKDN